MQLTKRRLFVHAARVSNAQKDETAIDASAPCRIGTSFDQYNSFDEVGNVNWNSNRAQQKFSLFSPMALAEPPKPPTWQS